MKNVALINLKVWSCLECPFIRGENGSLYCTRESSDLLKKGIVLDDPEIVPDFCPFVLERIQNMIDAMDASSYSAMPKKWLNAIEKRQKEGDPNQKFMADHGFAHAERVYQYGKEFLENCAGYGYSSPDMVQKEKLLLRIAAKLHDIGLADSPRNHAIHSSELAKKYLLKMNLDINDVQMITHAIFNHSKGKETDSIIDAALILGDKLDVTRERIIRPNNSVLYELSKVKKVSFKILGTGKNAERTELRYYIHEDAENFDVMQLRDWKKCISIPKMISEEWLEISDFKFFVDNSEVDVTEILKD